MAAPEGQDSQNTVEDFVNLRWQALTLTYVEYPKGDLFGFLLACCSLSPVALSVSFLTLIVFRRDLHTICFFAGLVLSELVNFILKHTIRDPRPARDVDQLYTEFGMPSSHSQFMWFFAVYLALFIFIRVHQMNNSCFVDVAWKYTTAAVGFSMALVVSYGRIYLLYHTAPQVFWGALVGLLLGGAWFLVVHLLLTPFFPVVASWPVSELLLVRDCTLIPNVLWFEYTSYRAEARSRQRKLTTMKSQ